MERKQAAQITKILIIVSGLFLLGTVIYLFFNSRREDNGDTLNPMFGKLLSPIDKNIFTEISVSNTSNFSNTPTSNKVYSIDNKNFYLPSRDIVSKLAKKMGLKLSYRDDKLLEYEGKNILLIYDVSAKLISIDNKVPTTNTSKQLLSEQQAQILARSELVDIGLWPYTSNYKVTFKYYSIIGLNFYEINTSENASLLGVVFSQEIEGFPLTSTDAKSGEIEVIIDKNENIKEISYAYRPVSESDFGTYPLRSLTKAFNDINNKNCELQTPFETETPTSVEIEKIVYSYRILFDYQAVLQPVYLFEGKDNKNNIVTFIVPAIENQYITEPITSE